MYREFGYTEESTPEIRSHLETVVALNPDFAPAYAFLSVANIQKPGADNQRALDAATRAARLEPGNLSYYIDIGMVLLADGKFAEARKLADQATKTAFTARDRMIVASFAKRVDAKAKQVSSTPASRAAESQAQTTGVVAPGSSPLEPAHAEGKITELICGHPPEVVFTLTTSSSSLLLHIKDTTKIEIIEGQKSGESGPPCASWKDRHAQVEFMSDARQRDKWRDSRSHFGVSTGAGALLDSRVPIGLNPHYYAQ